MNISRPRTDEAGKGRKNNDAKDAKARIKTLLGFVFPFVLFPCPFIAVFAIHVNSGSQRLLFLRAAARLG
ncbi:hypothetical protein BH10BAC4_BH10BAC4_15240 [soil metagenome]